MEGPGDQVLLNLEKYQCLSTGKKDQNKTYG